MVTFAFTGSRRPGLSPAQERVLSTQVPYPNMFIHGGAIGADTRADTIFGGGAVCPIEVYPTADRYDFWLAKGEPRVVHDAQDPIVLNHIMVDRCDLLIACPSTMDEVLRSGTWATIRYARKVGKPLLLIYPDGSCPVKPRDLGLRT